MSQAILESPASGGAVATLDDHITSCAEEPVWGMAAALEMMAETLIGGEVGPGISLSKLGEAVLDVGPQGQWMLVHQSGRATCK